MSRKNPKRDYGFKDIIYFLFVIKFIYQYAKV